MELSKRKYKKSEVEELINEAIKKSQEKLDLEKEKVLELNVENKRLLLELDNYKNQDALINSAIKSAQKKADEIVLSAKKVYDLEIESLKSFVLRFDGYFSYIIEKYPHYPAVIEAKKVYDTVANVLDKKSSKDAVKEIEDSIKKAKNVGKTTFNPKQKIEDYVVATSDNGFNLDEVLNPGELHLEDLCKELGLIDEEK